MKTIVKYIKECLDIENFSYKFDIWFDSDEKHLKPILELMKDCRDRKIVQKDDIENFVQQYPDFKIREDGCYDDSCWNIVRSHK